MKTNHLRIILGALVLSVGALTASAQTTPPATPPNLPQLDPKLGQELKAIIAAHRDTVKALLEERKAALEALKNATPDQIAAIKAQLADIMRQHQLDQRELAKAIRDAIKARRDLQHPPPPSGG